MWHASWISFGIIATLFTWMAHRLESSRRPTRYASEASCRAIMAPLWNRMFILSRSWAISLTSCWNGSFRMSSSVDFWYRQISGSATVPGWYFRAFGLPCWEVDCVFPPPCTFLPFVPFFFVFLGWTCGCFQGALPLPGSFRWLRYQASSSLLGRGGGCVTCFEVLW